MPLNLVDTLCDLVRLPSVNPMGRNVSGPEFFEYRVTEYLERLFQQLGLPYETQTLQPKRHEYLRSIGRSSRSAARRRVDCL